MAFLLGKAACKAALISQSTGDDSPEAGDGEEVSVQLPRIVKK